MYTRMIKPFFTLCLFAAFTTLAIAQNDQAKLANEYFQQGEYAKAKTIYEQLFDDRRAIPLIHANYLQLLLKEADYKGADKYLRKALKLFPSNLQYQVDLASFYHITEQENEKQKFLSALKREYGENQYQLSMVAQNLVTHQMYDEAIDFYQEARKVNGRPFAFALDLAAIYRLKNDKSAMTEEYIHYAESNPANLTYVKNLFQNILAEEEDQNNLEKTLISKIQRNPDEVLYSDLLIWLELQRKNFYAAFLQARALDKRSGTPGDESMQIANIAYDNQAWDDAIDIYTYIIDEYGKSANYTLARRLLIRSQESKIKNEFPVDREAIRQLADDYAELYTEIGPNPTTLDALRNKALLHAFHLDELDTAARILDFIIHNNRSPQKLASESKLDLGDIYLLMDEPWESTLLYSQVEKSDKESPIGYNAKLRNARLNYFTGNFALAKSHLDILKLATTREISNDAIALSLLISDNTAFDSTDHVMEEFANVELLIFQNKTEEAKTLLNQILVENSGHSITDEIYWLQAKLELQAGNYDASIALLDKIINHFKYDILSDDAFYRKAVILQDHVKNEAAALETLTEFLKSYPGSLYAAEARNRIRRLRGDLLN